MGGDSIEQAVSVSEKKSPSPAMTDDSNTSSHADKEAGTHQTVELKRNLKSRHIQMIAIGGTIGTGLFITSGAAIAHAGPAGALIAYIFVGTIVYSVMMSLGEMVTYIPISGAFTSYASRFVDPSLGFAMGWIYWFSWAVTFALELSATGVILQYWAPNLNIAIPIAIFWVVITFLNFLPVSVYGEVESGLCVVKILTVIGFIIFAICIDFGAGQQGALFFHNWKYGNAFAEYLVSGAAGKFVGFWAVLIQAGFAYQGTELVGITAGEAENPRKTVPAAIRKTFYRILFFFVLTIFFIGLLVPSDNPDLLSSEQNATASPFVIAASLAGVAVLPAIINGVLMFVVLSAANSCVYSGSRILVGLAREGSAPAFLIRTTAQGVPTYAVLFTAACGLLAFLNLSATSGTVLLWLTNITGVAGFITWACINLCHIAFMRACAAQNISRDSLPYKAPAQPWFAWYGLFFNVLIIFTQGFTAFIPSFDTSSFFTAYISLILFAVLYVAHKAVRRCGFVKAADVDLKTGCVDALEGWGEEGDEESAGGSQGGFVERCKGIGRNGLDFLIVRG